MPSYRVSIEARRDLRAIARYTFERWGREQADRYTGLLLGAFEQIAQAPLLGRTWERIPTYRRLEQGRHVVVYRMEPAGVYIVRVLHQSMLLERHLP